MTKIIGLFGGTFDPVHFGHLRSIQLLCDNMDIERIHWVLSARPPHKIGISSVEHRFAMLQLALNEFDQFIADDSEIKREQKSYTFYTAQAFQQQNPGHAIALIVGNDVISQLHTWHRYKELLELVNIIVMNRPGHEVVLPAYLQGKELVSLDELSDHKAGRVALFEGSTFAVSSTQIRSLFTQSTSVKKQLLQHTLHALLPPAVVNYIHDNQLYEPIKKAE